MAINEGEKAPSFTAMDQDGKQHKLEDYKGKYVLLYFYPKDNTPGCTKEACSFRDNYAELKKYVTILGVSADSEKSHTGFREKYKLPFTLLSDKEKNIIKSYGADGIIMPKRVSFLINPDGMIVKVYKKVVPVEHAEQVLKDVSAL